MRNKKWKKKTKHNYIVEVKSTGTILYIYVKNYGEKQEQILGNDIKTTTKRTISQASAVFRFVNRDKSRRAILEEQKMKTN